MCRFDSGYTPHNEIYQYRKYKQVWKWSITNNNDCFLFLKKIIPYLHSRRLKRANEAISLFNDWTEKNKIISEQISERRNAIKSMRLSKKTHKEIAKIFGVERSYVTHVLNGKYD